MSDTPDLVKWADEALRGPENFADLGYHLLKLADEAKETIDTDRLRRTADLLKLLPARIRTLEAEAVASKLAHDCGFNAGVILTEARFKAALATAHNDAVEAVKRLRKGHELQPKSELSSSLHWGRGYECALDNLEAAIAALTIPEPGE